MSQVTEHISNTRQKRRTGGNMALSLLHQTISNVGATWTPDLTTNGWFTVHWYNDHPLNIEPPTALLGLQNGQEFLVDIIVHDTTGGAGTTNSIVWDPFYLPGDFLGFDDGVTGGRTQYYDGNMGSLEQPCRGLRIMVLNGTGRLLSQSRIRPY